MCVFSEIPANAILELFGKAFFEFCQDSGYDKILQVLGATPRDFLQVSESHVKSRTYRLLSAALPTANRVQNLCSYKPRRKYLVVKIQNPYFHHSFA
jgi:hypothetical protein